MLKYYHGGRRGLKEILPSSITGVPSTASFGAGSVCKRDVVYVTTDFDSAKWFAAMNGHKTACVYKVKPIGDIRHDPDTMMGANFSFECDRAEIVRVFKLSGSFIKKTRKAAFISEGLNS